MAETDPARVHYTAVQRIVRAVAVSLQATYRGGLDTSQVGASFTDTVTPVFAATVAGGQQQAASLAEPYLAATIGEQAFRVAPGAFAGTTAAGVPLEVVANTALARMLADLNAGAQPSTTIARGLTSLLTYAHTEIADAARAAVQTQLISDPSAAGHERVVSLPACDRCIMLAGKFYKYSTGFARHPNCDCGMRPVTAEQWRNEHPENTPGRLFESMSTEAQNAAFGRGNAEAIRTGADISQVVNARRGAVRTAGQEWSQTTSYGTTTRGWYGGYTATERATKRPGQRYRRTNPRPTAAAIIDRANAESMSREELVQTLYRYGYLL